MEEFRYPVALAELQTHCGPMTFSYFNTWMGARVTQEILNGQTYPKVPFIESPKCIVDVGANIGAASVYFTLEYPDSKVWAFEPALESFALLERNSAIFENITACPVGLWRNDETMPIFLGGIDPVTNSVGKSSSNLQDSVTIELRNAADEMRSKGIDRIDILKLDTEGCEIAILSTLQKMLPYIGVIYVEYHSEEDRRCIDNMLADTHILYSGRVNHLHRGEFCYVAKARFPSEAELNKFRICIAEQ